VITDSYFYFHCYLIKILIVFYHSFFHFSFLQKILALFVVTLIAKYISFLSLSYKLFYFFSLFSRQKINFLSIIVLNLSYNPISFLLVFSHLLSFLKTSIYLWNCSSTNFFTTSSSLFWISHFFATLFTSIIFSLVCFFFFSFFCYFFLLFPSVSPLLLLFWLFLLLTFTVSHIFLNVLSFLSFLSSN